MKDQEFIVEKIRTQYTERQHTELDDLKALDAKVKKPANVFAYAYGAAGAVVMGAGMSLVMTNIGAMIGLTRSLAQYGAKYGVRCVCVSPGPVLTRAAMANMKTMLGRAAEPQEIIDLILFIASDKGQFINGENIMIDGGRNAMKPW